jgi:hypothetical protein
VRVWRSILFMFVCRYGKRDRLLLEDWGEINFFFLIDKDGEIFHGKI